jgi:hypothetical protein
VATGRLILLHDPAGHDVGRDHAISDYVTAELEPDLAADPLLPAVGWSWLTDALDAQDAGYRAIGGTGTQTMSTRFGELAGPPAAGDIEIRASWTPLDDEVAPHLPGRCAHNDGSLPPPGVTAAGRRWPAPTAEPTTPARTSRRDARRDLKSEVLLGQP